MDWKYIGKRFFIILSILYALVACVFIFDYDLAVSDSNYLFLLVIPLIFAPIMTFLGSPGFQPSPSEMQKMAPKINPLKFVMISAVVAIGLALVWALIPLVQ